MGPDFLVAWPCVIVILSTMLEMLAAGILFVLVVMLVLLASLSRSVARMESRMGKQVISTAPSLPEESMASRKIEHREDFMTFLVEDPERRKLPKRDQFAAYRDWRKAKGLSWPAAVEKTD